ncbi:MAG: hypothetical protein M3O70_17745 [Actinomycetota bacterium]|nr:hypothetical protein [Actinomycetota bacterium]
MISPTGATAGSPLDIRRPVHDDPKHAAPLLDHAQHHQHDCLLELADVEEADLASEPGVAQQPEPPSPRHRNRVPKVSTSYRKHGVKDVGSHRIL